MYVYMLIHRHCGHCEAKLVTLIQSRLYYESYEKHRGYSIQNHFIVEKPYIIEIFFIGD